MSMHRRAKSVARMLGAAVGAALIVVLVRRIGVQALRQALSRVGPNVAWLFVVYAAATAVAAIPWRQLMPSAARPGWGATLTSRFAASGLSVLFPFLGVGEGARLLWIDPAHRRAGLAALISDRALFSAAGALVLGAALATAAHVAAIPRAYRVGGLASAIALATAAGALLVAQRRRRGTAALSGYGTSLIAGLALHVGARALFMAEAYVGLRVLGAQPTFAETLVFGAVPIALSVAGVFVPGQIGLQETVQTLVSTVLGIGPATGLALVLLQRARQLLFVALSALLIAFARHEPRPSEKT